MVTEQGGDPHNDDNSPDQSGDQRAVLRLKDLRVVQLVLQEDNLLLELDDEMLPRPVEGLFGFVPLENGQPIARLLEPANAVSLTTAINQAIERRAAVTLRVEYEVEERGQLIEATVIPVFADDGPTCRHILCWGRDVVADYNRLIGEMFDAPGLAGELAQGVHNDDFALYYQPIHELRTGRLVGAEALLRWHHPQRGLLLPADFIPLAEETGLIVDLGEWVLREACAEAASWNKAGVGRLGVSVNISAREVRSGSVLRSVHAALAASGLDPTLLTVELTESDLIGDRSGIYALLAHLRAIGVQVAIDDFGTGYSNLARLRQMRGRIVKIDRSLVAGIHEDEAIREMLSAVAGLVKSLDCVIVAEGVEQPEELDELRALGFDYSQGFHHARPMDGDDFSTYVATSVEMPLH